MADPTTPRPRNGIAAFVVFVLFCATIAILYLNNRREWMRELSEARLKVDSLSLELAEIRALRRKEAARIQHVREIRFDPFDADDYRVYGLYRDEEKQYSNVQMGKKFNIHPPNAIKTANILDERWHIVPIKTIHFYDGSESLTQIADFYYENPGDSILIEAFNPRMVPGKHIFIPFD